MRKKFPFIVNLTITTVGVICGAMLAIAVTPLLTTPPVANTTVVNFNALNVDNGAFNIFNNGKFVLYNTIDVDFDTDTTGNLNPLPFGLDINSENAGMHILGHYIGLRGLNKINGELFGRVGVEGRVTALQSSGGISTVRGFAGYLEYDSSLNPVVENGINLDTLPNNLANTLRDDFVGISKGVPWAFYTEDASKFKEDVEITGILSADPGPIAFADYTGPRHDPVLEISPGSADLLADTIIAEDYIATDDLSSQFFVKYANDAFSNHSNGAVFSESVYCPMTPTPAIRLGCGGGIINSSHAPNHSPYLGVKQISSRGCRAYARKPAGSIPGELKVYAFCWKPE